MRCISLAVASCSAGCWMSGSSMISPEEKHTLDVPRLREVWAHTASGCLKCRQVIKTLNLAREMLRAKADA
jgi:hypothetical protein